MIAPIREPECRRERSTTQRRKARRWIVESLMSRSEVEPRRVPSAGWKAWLAAFWIVMVAATYLVKMLGGYFAAP